MLAPAAISLLPGLGIRPALMRTCGRSARLAAPIPRIVTFAGRSPRRCSRLISTMISLATSRSPPAPTATSGWTSTIAAASRATELCTSVCEDFRISTALSYDPVSTSVARSPAASICIAANTNTTIAMPAAVSTVVSRRVQRLRREYEYGIAIRYRSLCKRAGQLKMAQVQGARRSGD